MHETIRLDETRLMIVNGVPHNQEACRITDRFRSLESNGPNLILVLGGDGAMLDAIRKYWKLSLPILGLNYGTVGYLLNDPAIFADSAALAGELEVWTYPLLEATMKRPDGGTIIDYAFNDAWVQADSSGFVLLLRALRELEGQVFHYDKFVDEFMRRNHSVATWLEVSVDGEVVIPRMASDGLLVSTAGGSTAYAKAMGATPIPMELGSMIMVGNNVFLPSNWRSAPLRLEQKVKIRSLDPERRPMLGFVDGVNYGQVVEVDIAASPHTVNLLFCPESSPQQKFKRMQFHLS